MIFMLLVEYTLRVQCVSLQQSRTSCCHDSWLPRV